MSNSELKNNAETESSLQREKFKKYLNPKYIQRGFLVFAFITILSFFLLFLYTNTAETLNAFRNIHIKYLLLALLLAFFDWWVGGYRNHIFVREIKPGISWKVCFNANLANIFMGAVTPSQTGGGPAQLYMLYRNGIRIMDGLAVSLINFVATALFFPISALVAYLIVKGTINDPLIITLIKSGFVLFSVFFSVVLISILLPKKMGKFLHGISKVLYQVFPDIGKKLMKLTEKLYKQLLGYNKTMRHFIRKKPILLPYSFILTCILYLTKYTIAFCILLGLGINIDYLTVIAIQAIIFFILYFAPSPGASGIAELSIAVLMAQIMPESLLASFTMMHRGFLLFLPALLGAYIVLKELKKHSISVVSD